MANGSLGEAAVLKELIKQGYTVFTQFDGQSPFDMVAYRDGLLYKVSVKSTSVSRYSGSYRVVLAQHQYSKQKLFSKADIDILAVYIVPEDTVVLIDASTIKNKHTLEIRVPNTGNTVDI